MRLHPVLCAVLTTAALSGCSGQEPATPAPQASEASTPAPSAPVSASASPSAAAAPDIEGLELVEGLSNDHVAGPVEYDRVPPVGGPHNVRWLACGVYDAPVPDEFAVHSIEHGAVWVNHAPDLPAAEREALAALAAANPEYVLVSPREGLDSRVVAVTWGAAIEATSADDPRLEAFVEAYAGGGQGGEPGAPCRSGGLTPEQARAQLGG
jgi:hypothetical protein